MWQLSTLSNGLTVVTVPMPYARSVGVALAYGVGACHEPDEQAGRAHFVEHLCFKGTARRPRPEDISSELEGVGGMLNGGTGREETVYYAKVSRPHLSRAIDLLFDMAQNSLFDEAEIDKERRVIIEEIRMSLDIPQQRVSMLIDTLLWPDQPLGRDVAGTIESVTGVPRDRLVAHMREKYRPSNLVVGVAGNIEHDRVCDEVFSHSMPDEPHQPDRRYRADAAQAAPRIEIDRRDGEQTHVCIAAHGVSRLDRLRFVMDIMHVVLGGGMSSRLFLEVREKKGLAYDIHSYTEHFATSGTLAVYAGVEPQRLNECIRAVVEELGRLKQGIGGEELTRAKELTKGRLELRLEDTQNAAMWYGYQQLLNGEILSVEEVCSRIDAVTSDDVASLAEDLLTTPRLSLAVVGPVQGDITPDLLSL
jgi:predicted Zn-dependent peptidase